MRHLLTSFVCLAALALVGCSKSENSDSSSGGGGTAAPAAMSDAAPGIAVTAAPGVAFNYRYAVRLPAEKLAAAQETHAEACEKLGVARCRITGMRYRVLGENSNEGTLLFKLDPTLARAFGKQGIDAITAAEGELVDAEITSTDAGAEIAKQQGLGAQAAAELQRIDGELKRTDLKSDERAELQNQRAAITDRITAAKASVGEQTESLANTPMEFDYESGPAIQGFDGSAPITSAANVFVGSAAVTIGFVLTLLAALAPPGIITLCGFLLGRRVRPRRRPAVPPADGPA